MFVVEYQCHLFKYFSHYLYCSHLSLLSSLGVVLQAEDRIHRLGQTAKEVRIIYMIARNTVDEIVWEQIQRKHQVVGATVGKAPVRPECGDLHWESFILCNWFC